MRVFASWSLDVKASQLGKLAPVAAFNGAVGVLCKVPQAASTLTADSIRMERMCVSSVVCFGFEKWMNSADFKEAHDYTVWVSCPCANEQTFADP